ncbi:MAG: Ig-like domain-containing protein, partial [Acidimicrobiia bacterium]
MTRRVGRYVGVVACLALLASGVAWALTPSVPSIWIDDPLDGATFDMTSPIQVVGHVSDPNGVEQVRLDVDTVEIASSQTATDPGTLATVEFEWQPDSTGQHTLGLWVKPTNG